MQRIQILFILFSITVSLIDKTRTNGKALMYHKNYVPQQIRLRSFTPLKNLRLLEKNFEVEQKLREEKQAEELRRKISKDMEEQMKKMRIIQNYLYLHRLGSQSFLKDFQTNRLF